MAIYLCLDELLKERGMSVSALALEVGITRANVSNIKTGNIKALRFSTLDKLCEVLDCEPGDIIKYRPSRCEDRASVAANNENEGADEVERAELESRKPVSRTVKDSPAGFSGGAIRSKPA